MPALTRCSGYSGRHSISSPVQVRTRALMPRSEARRDVEGRMRCCSFTIDAILAPDDPANKGEC